MAVDSDLQTYSQTAPSLGDPIKPFWVYKMSAEKIVNTIFFVPLSLDVNYSVRVGNSVD